MSDKIKKLLAVSGMPMEEQVKEIAKYIQPKPWSHTLTTEWHNDSSPDHVCRKCNRKWQSKLKHGPYATGEPLNAYLAEEHKIYDIEDCDVPDELSESLADLAFWKNNGTIAGKTPIEYIVDALIKEMEKAE